MASFSRRLAKVFSAYALTIKLVREKPLYVAIAQESWDGVSLSRFTGSVHSIAR